MAHKCSEDLKEQAVKYVEAGHSYRSASVIFGSTATTIKCWYKKYLLLGHVRTQKRLGKKPRISNEEFIRYVELHPDQTLKEIGAYFEMTDVGALYYMRKTGISYKKKEPRYKEACAEKRHKYLSEIAEIRTQDIVYIDESGLDKNCYKQRGWGKIGQKLIGKVTGKRIKRTNIIAGLCGQEVVAPMIFEGSCNTELFVKWMTEILIPELKKGQVVVMDNASFHKSPRIRTAIEQAGCRLIYLPPYSPDLNPIEIFWANMKKWIKYNIPHITNTWNTIIQFFDKSIST